jgi:hypothetical protein
MTPPRSYQQSAIGVQPERPSFSLLLNADGGKLTARHLPPHFAIPNA